MWPTKTFCFFFIFLKYFFAMTKIKNTSAYTLAARWKFFLEWSGWAMWHAMFLDITVQIPRTFFCISYPLITRGPRSNSSSLTFIFSVYFVWRSDSSLVQRPLKKKKNHQPELSRFCNVNKSINQRTKREFFPTHSGAVYPPMWNRSIFFAW